MLFRSPLRSKESVKLSRRIADESTVLLKNDGQLLRFHIFLHFRFETDSLVVIKLHIDLIRSREIGLTFSWPERLEDSPVYELATQDVDNVNYEDSLMVGYRYFDTKRVTPRYEFGYGLSYTTFDYSKMKVKKDGDNCVVTLHVKNTGSRDGAEVVQIYVGQKNCRYTRPVHELKAFDKVFLKPGESREVTFTLDKDAFSYWNPDRRAWVRDSDEFTIEAGHSSRDIRRSAKVRF